METLHDKVGEILDSAPYDEEANTLHPDSIEVGGVKIVEIRDKKGRVWAVPADDANVDHNEGAFRNILNIPNPEPDFYYQYVGADRLNDYLSRDFALVEPDEVGLPKAHSDAADAANASFGVRSAAHHQVGNLHLVKIPKVLERRYRIAQKMRADEAVAGIRKGRHTGRDGKQISDDVQVNKAETKTVTGKPIVTPQPGYKEYPTE